jgi:hypothetical protein
MPVQALAVAATLIGFVVQGNRVDLRLDRGAAEITWASERTFRVRRSLEGPLAKAERYPSASVAFRREDSREALRLRTKYIEVTVTKRGALVTVRRLGGELLMSELTAPVAEGDGLIWERQVPAETRYWGRTGASSLTHNVGAAGAAETPILFSSAGYADYFGGHEGRFQFTGPDRYVVVTPQPEYWFVYGPTPKRIVEEKHKSLAGMTSWVKVLPRQYIASISAAPGVDTKKLRAWGNLRIGFLKLVHDAVESPSSYFSLDSDADEPPEVLHRARQIGSLVPGVRHEGVELSGFSQQLAAFFLSYQSDTENLGYPLWRPLPFQFPDDPECLNHADQFMLGDEMLVAPIYTAENKRSVYLPPGNWTNLETNAVEPGRRTITVETSSLPVFARNGTIVPLNSAGGMALHYFPALGAEFFILEPDVKKWTQVHAAPAADVFRLEIESKVPRAYQWVVHHVEKPSSVAFEDRKYAEAERFAGLAEGSWFYDAAQKNLHIKVRVAEGEDNVIHVEW